MKLTEKIFHVNLSTKMTGRERYPILGVGNGVPDEVIQRQFKGLSLYGACVEKNWIAKHYAPDFAMILGAVRIISADGKGAFGHDYVPPTELHAWLEGPDGQIIDFALPGLVLAGSKLRDEKGPFIIGREPAILAGFCPKWVLYRGCHLINDAKVSQVLALSTRYDA